MNSGRFIVFEGGEGAGKDTQIALLESLVGGEEYLFVRDPGSTEIGLKLREIVLHDTRVAPQSELMMYLAARVQLIEEKIKPTLKEGKTVISNRFDLSTIAYQIYGRERQDLFPFLTDLSEYALAGTKPDVVVLLDCPPEVGLARTKAAKSLDRLEREKMSFHERVREGYLAHIGNYKEHYVIDATKSPEEVHTEVRRVFGV